MPTMKTNYGQEGWIPGTAGGTSGANAFGQQINENTGELAGTAINQLKQLFNILKLERTAGIAHTSPYPNAAVDDWTFANDANGENNTINTGSTTAYYDTANFYYIMESQPSVDNTSTELTNPGFESATGWTFSFDANGGTSGSSAQDNTWGSKTGSFDWKGEITGNSPSAGNTSRAWATRTVTWANIAGVKADWEIQSSGGIGNGNLGVKGDTGYGNAVNFGSGNASGTDTFVNTENITGTDFVVKMDRSAQAGTGTFTGYIDDLKTFKYATGKFIQTNALTNSQTIATNINRALVLIEYVPSQKGTDALTVDISSDNGATYTTGNVLTAYHTAGSTFSASTGIVSLTSTLGKQLILKINLGHSTYGSTPKIYRYAVMFWTV